MAWWQARAAGGYLVLRLEDLDVERSDPRWSQRALEDLRWLGLDWRGDPWLQSDGREELDAAVVRLAEAGQLYPCVCTRRELSQAASAPHGSEHKPYPGTCRGRFETHEEAHAATGRMAAWRFRVSGGSDHLVRFHDRLRGSIALDVAATSGDFPVTRRDGTVAYQLAVVVDDARQGVTEVLRGDDLLDSTPRQILLSRALGLELPHWTHVPLVVDDAGKRLAKRTDGLAIAELRARGVDPRALVGWVARSAGIEVEGRATANELAPAFRLEALPPTPVRFGARELAALERGR